MNQSLGCIGADCDNVASLAYFGPELGLVAACLLVIVWDLFAKSQRAKILGSVGISMAALIFSGGSSALALAASVEPKNLFFGLLAFDDFANTFRILFAVVTGLILLFVAPPLLADDTPADERKSSAEMFALLLVLTLGMNLMASSRNLLMIYISIETVSVISFVLAGFKIANRKSSEAALKYVIYGGVASGVMLYGMSWVYGATGSLQLGKISASLAAQVAQTGKLPEAVF
ncbi:MAG: NADH-quinone oxidoreductase subunit N, partial [Myxococcales bacterium]|nr:NADH-quinone oxidoreductase subunit N [Myxococcales bacterium]